MICDYSSTGILSRSPWLVYVIMALQDRVGLGRSFVFSYIHGINSLIGISKLGVYVIIIRKRMERKKGRGRDSDKHTSLTNG